MYTTTDVSDVEPTAETHDTGASLPRTTSKLILFILRKIEGALCYAAYRQCTSSSASVGRNEPRLVSNQSSRKLSHSSGQKRKAALKGSPGADGNDEGDAPQKRRRGSATTNEESETGAKFACPFYKHEPDRYRSRRTCPGPGWPTVHRMKEHLYRSHAQPIFCPICYTTFKSDKEQSVHIRIQQCQRSAPQYVEGIDRETISTLRKRTTTLRLEEEKWRDVYQLLFPDVSSADIPSPCE